MRRGSHLACNGQLAQTFTFHLQRFPANFYNCALTKQAHIPANARVKAQEKETI